MDSLLFATFIWRYNSPLIFDNIVVSCWWKIAHILTNVQGWNYNIQVSYFIFSGSHSATEPRLSKLTTSIITFLTIITGCPTFGLAKPCIWQVKSDKFGHGPKFVQVPLLNVTSFDLSPIQGCTEYLLSKPSIEMIRVLSQLNSKFVWRFSVEDWGFLKIRYLPHNSTEAVRLCKFLNFLDGIKSFLFRILVTSGLGFKVRIDPLACTPFIQLLMFIIHKFCGSIF